MADQTFDARFDALLREALRAEAASLPLTVGSEQILDRRQARRGRFGWRVGLPRLSMAVAAGVAVALIAVGAMILANLPRGIDGPAAPLPTSAADPSSVTASPSPTPPTSGGMWPQAKIADVHAAQARADAGDPGYTWQLDEQLAVDYDPAFARFNSGDVEIVDRFIREVLGWEAYMPSPFEGGDANVVDGYLTNQRFLRCAAGRTNALYPPGPDSDERGESCAPTIDDLTYEVVSLDLGQAVRPKDQGGIWVVLQWRLTAPFAQADPAVIEARDMGRLEAFLAARVAGAGAEGYVDVNRSADGDVPLMYATSSGSPYERYEIERLTGPRWPYGVGTFVTRLFADGGATVVEQEIAADAEDGLWMDVTSTTENGQPVTLSWSSADGEVSASGPSTWRAYWPGKVSDGLAPDVWFGLLGGTTSDLGGDAHIGLVDPVAYDAWCAANGGSPLLSGPANAADIAQQVMASPDFETTAAVAVRIGGLEGISMDVTLAPGGEACTARIGFIVSDWIHQLPDVPPDAPALRLRLYLVDLPDGMSVETLAITVVAPNDRFEDFVAEAAPIIESIEFHPRGGDPSPSAAP